MFLFIIFLHSVIIDIFMHTQKGREGRREGEKAEERK